MKVKVLIRSNLDILKVFRSQAVFKYHEQEQFNERGFVIRQYSRGSDLFWLFINIPYSETKERYFRYRIETVMKMIRKEVDRLGRLILSHLELGLF